MVVKRGALQVVGHADATSPVKFDVPIQILALYQLKAKSGYALVERVGQFAAHGPEQPAEDRPDAERVAEDLALALVAADEVQERLLLVGSGLTGGVGCLLLHLPVVLQVEYALGQQGKPAVVE